MARYPLALVTGAACRLGRSFAVKLAEHGYALLLHYHRSFEEVDKVRDEVHSLGVPAHVVEADLTDPAQVNSLFSKLDSLGLEFSVLVNSAATMKRADLWKLTLDEWDDTLNINLRAPLLLSQGAAARMVKGGLIVNVTDAGAWKTWTGFPAYQVSKGALEILTRLLAKTYAPEIRVNAIAPGLVLPADDMPEDEWMKLINRLPLKRPTSIEDVTSALEFLLENSSITGQTVVIDGGYSLI
jgi:NAD(P)-dependent dehydrogenase (short-subunit alcohol dehydrogenase family)